MELSLYEIRYKPKTETEEPRQVLNIAAYSEWQARSAFNDVTDNHSFEVIVVRKLARIHALARETKRLF